MKYHSIAIPARLACFLLDRRSIRRWLAAGLFATMISSANSSDVPFMTVLKGQRFEQVSPTVAFMTEGEPPLIFEAFAIGENASSILSGTVQVPSGEIFSLVCDDPDDAEFAYEDVADTLLDFDTSKSNGIYTISVITTNDGTRSVSLNLAGNNYPNVPLISNYTSLQSAIHSSDITVQWGAMTSGTTNDFIMCSITDDSTGEDAYESGAPGEPDALNGTNTQVILPPDTLQPGHLYRAEVLFVKLVDADTTSYPNCQAISGYYKQVEFSIKTTALPGTALGATFEGAIPKNYTRDVPRDSAISFQFSHPMDTNYFVVSWTGPGVASSGFEYEWIDGNKVLLCKYTYDFPANIDVDWTLDLADFRDAAGFQLIGDPSGSFHTSSNEPQSPPDVDSIYMSKFREYQQTGSGPVSSGIFGCILEVDLKAYNRVKDASMTINANGRSLALSQNAWEPEMGTEVLYASKTDLDLFFANGDFTFDLNTLADGAKTFTFSLGASDDYPDVPTITNLPELQTIDKTTPTTITWDTLMGWSSSLAIGSKTIEIEIDNEQGNEVFFLDKEAFTNGSECTIPAGTLSPGRTYEVCLIFSKTKDFDDNTYSGVLGECVFSSITSFAIQTAGDPIRPILLVEEVGGNMNINFNGGESNWCYVLETSRDLQRWLPCDLVGGDGNYFDYETQYLNSRFYRLRDCVVNEPFQRNRSIQGTVWMDDTQTTPVKDAVVGTSMDQQTIVTDKNGQFFLETDTPNGSGEYWVEVTSGTINKNFGPFTGDQPREQNYPMGQFQDKVSIEGTVWTDFSYTTRVANATVGTDLDDQTVVSDGNGNFFLQTNTPSNYGSTPYTITIKVGGVIRFSKSHTWGDHPTNQNFGLDE